MDDPHGDERVRAIMLLQPLDFLRTGLVSVDVATASHASAAMLARWRDTRLASLLRAARRSALYAPWLDASDAAATPFEDLPVIQKSELMGRFSEWVTDPALELDALKAFVADPTRIAQPYLDQYTVWESSGSSGEPGIFVQDPSAMAVYDAIESLRRPVLHPLQRLLDPLGLTESMVFVGATNGHFASTVSVERIRRLHPAMASGLRQVSFLQPLAAMLTELQALAPRSVATYPSVALLLAEAQLAGRLDIRPREIWTGGETLTSAVRCRIRQAFHCPVINTYGSSEFLSLAFECRHGHLHLNSDWAILESVDDRHEPVPNGRPGATSLLTNLANHVQPIIRYDIGDSITVHDSALCECGSALPVIEVHGREDDILRLGELGATEVALTPLALSTVLEADAGLYDFQLVQRGPMQLVLSTGQEGAQARDALSHARQVLSAFLASQGAKDVHIDCRSGEAGQRGRSGKVKRVVKMAA